VIHGICCAFVWPRPTIPLIHKKHEVMLLALAMVGQRCRSNPRVVLREKVESKFNLCSQLERSQTRISTAQRYRTASKISSQLSAKLATMQTAPLHNGRHLGFHVPICQRNTASKHVGSIYCRSFPCQLHLEAERRVGFPLESAHALALTYRRTAFKSHSPFTEASASRRYLIKVYSQSPGKHLQR
jgi:hypothetical protein